MAETLTIRTASSTEVIQIAVPGPQGATGPQGPAGAGGVTSVTGTAPIVSSGGTTPAISISEATTSAAGSMSSADKAKLDAGSFTTLSASNDMEITDATKGVVLKSPNNTRYRLTVSNSGLPIFTALLLMMLAQLASAQNIGMATDTNGTILTDRTNTLIFTNPLTWATNVVAATRANLGLGATWLTNTNVTNFRTAIGLGATNNVAFSSVAIGGGNLIFSNDSIYWSTNVRWSPEDNVFSTAIQFDSTNIATETRANLGLGSLATNNSVPSGAATTNSLLTADGAGGSAFVVSRTVTKFTTNDQTKTNWGFNAGTQATNDDVQMGSWALDANSFYRVEYAVAWVATTNSGFAHALGFTTNLSEFNHRAGVGQAANTTVTAINTGTNATTIALANASAAATGGRFAVAGFVYLLTSSNANTMNYRWYPINNSADATTLIRSSMISVTKMAP